ncbi:MAG: hypothetical protein EBU82_12890 [Flavobacteriia bacterium]|nr:hypothetical protein [Flavobacteriia bacterium]
MNKLAEAETYDHYFEKIRNDPVNKKARDSLFYGAVSEDIKPWLLNTQIVTMHPTAEAGLPHTRPPNIICMPQYFPEERMPMTLAHELVHVDQRRRKYKWDAYFEREGWRRIGEEDIPERWLQRCRMNPDTIDDRFWAWQGRHVPLPIFEREDKPDLRQVIIQWWDRTTGIKQSQAPRSFLERYGSFPSQPEHPRELAAVELSKIFQTPSDIDSYLNP